MEFKFKRNYNIVFFFSLILLTVTILSMYLISTYIEKNVKPTDFNNFNSIYYLLWINFLLMIIAFTSLTKRKYIFTSENILVKRSLLSNITIEFEKIKEIKYNDKDKMLLVFWTIPSIKIVYQENKATREIVIRTDKSEFLKKMIEKEKQIHINKLKNS